MMDSLVVLPFYSVHEKLLRYDSLQPYRDLARLASKHVFRQNSLGRMG